MSWGGSEKNRWIVGSVGLTRRSDQYVLIVFWRREHSVDYWINRAQFQSTAKQKKSCLAWNFSLDKNRITKQFSMWFLGQANNSWRPVTSHMKQMEILLVIPFLSRLKFHAKQIFVLSSSMKLGPVQLLNCVGIFVLLILHTILEFWSS